MATNESKMGWPRHPTNQEFLPHSNHSDYYILQLGAQFDTVSAVSPKHPLSYPPPYDKLSHVAPTHKPDSPDSTKSMKMKRGTHNELLISEELFVDPHTALGEGSGKTLLRREHRALLEKEIQALDNIIDHIQNNHSEEGNCAER